MSKDKSFIEVRSLDCAGGSCCPDAVVHEDRRVTLTEGVFQMTLLPESATELRKLLEKHGY